MRRFCLALMMLLMAADGTLLAGEEDEYLRIFLSEAASLRNLMLYREAISIYQELLTMDLPLKERIRIHVLLAKCYERVDGETARYIWRDIRDLYPDHPVTLQAARRLGLLYSCGTPIGLKKSLPKAAEQFEYILQRAPRGSKMAILAHVNLAQIYPGMKQYEKALKHHQAIYDLKESDLVLSPEELSLPEKERAARLNELKKQLARLRKWVLPRMVGCCRRKTIKETIAALRALRARYKNDPKVIQAVDKALARYQKTTPKQKTSEDKKSASTALPSDINRIPPANWWASHS